MIKIQRLAGIKIFGKYGLLPIVMLVVAEAFLIFLSFYAGVIIRFGAGAQINENLGGPIWPRAVVFTTCMLVSLYAMGLFKVRIREASTGIVLRIAVACFVGAAATTLIFYAMPFLYTGRGVLFLALAVAFVLMVAVRLQFMRLVDEKMFKRRVLVFGAGEKALSLARLRRRSDRRGFAIVGYVPDSGDSPTVDSDKLVSVDGTLLDYAVGNNINEIVVAVDERRRSVPVRELLACRIAGIQVTDVIQFFERESGKVRLDLLYPSWLIFSEGFEGNANLQVIKRSLDLLLSIFLIFLTWPIMLIAALAIKASEGVRAPILYRQERVGLCGQKFEVLKFRSMRVDAEGEDGAQWASQNDDRITGVGRWLRKLRIDELPQLINVLAGDMALVGPRPERPEFVVQLEQSIPYYQERHSVKPGITGWAQLSYPYGSSEKDAREKLQYDLYYVKHQGLLFDLQIILQTVEVIIFNRGAR